MQNAIFTYTENGLLFTFTKFAMKSIGGTVWYNG